MLTEALSEGSSDGQKPENQTSPEIYRKCTGIEKKYVEFADFKT